MPRIDWKIQLYGQFRHADSKNRVHFDLASFLNLRVPTEIGSQHSQRDIVIWLAEHGHAQNFTEILWWCNFKLFCKTYGHLSAPKGMWLGCDYAQPYWVPSSFLNLRVPTEIGSQHSQRVIVIWLAEHGHAQNSTEILWCAILNCFARHMATCALVSWNCSHFSEFGHMTFALPTYLPRYFLSLSWGNSAVQTWKSNCLWQPKGSIICLHPSQLTDCLSQLTDCLPWALCWMPGSFNSMTVAPVVLDFM